MSNRIIRGKMNISTFIHLLLSFILICVLLLLKINYYDSYSITLVEGIKWISIIAFFIISYIAVSAWKLNKGLNFYILFIAGSYMFYFGQHLLVLFESKSLQREYLSIVDGRISDFYIFNSGFFILQSLLLVHIGYLIFTAFSKPKIKKISRLVDCKSENKYILIVGWLLFIITILPAFYTVSMDLIETISKGYLARVQDAQQYGLSGVKFYAKYLSGWFLPSIYLLLISGKKKERKIVLFVSIIYAAIYMLGGSRFRIFEMLIAIFLIYHFWISPFKFKKIMKFSLIGFMIFSILTLIPVLRLNINHASSIRTLMENSIEQLVSNGPLYKLFYETGITHTTIANILENCPSVIPHSFGKSIQGSLLLTLPSFLRGDVTLNDYSLSIIFTPLYKGNIFGGVYGGYGSSFIAEAYYNFSHFTPIVMMIYGGLLAFLCYKTSASVKRKEPLLFFACVYISSVVFFGLRSDLVMIPRYVLNYTVFPILAIKFLKLIGKTHETKVSKQFEES